jgi:hypothetical protein
MRALARARALIERVVTRRRAQCKRGVVEVDARLLRRCMRVEVRTGSASSGRFVPVESNVEERPKGQKP